MSRSRRCTAICLLLREISTGALLLQAVMVVADDKQSLTITGNGDVLEPHDGIIGERSALMLVVCCAMSSWKLQQTPALVVLK